MFVGGALRLREHLTGEQNAVIKPCTKVPQEVVAEMQGLLKEKQEAKSRKRKKEVLDQITNSKAARNTGVQQALPSMFANKDTVDASVARALYSAGISFNVKLET